MGSTQSLACDQPVRSARTACPKNHVMWNFDVSYTDQTATQSCTLLGPYILLLLCSWLLSFIYVLRVSCPFLVFPLDLDWEFVLQRSKLVATITTTTRAWRICGEYHPLVHIYPHVLLPTRGLYESHMWHMHTHPSGAIHCLSVSWGVMV